MFFTHTTLNSFLVAFLITILFLLTPKVTVADTPVKVSGTGETNITVWLPTDSVPENATVTADYIDERDLPNRIKYPPGTVGQAFTFGVWDGEGKTLPEYTPSIVINATYQDDDIPLSVRSEEATLHLHMYNPATKAWQKLCSSVDIHENVVSAALSFPTPYEEDGSSLMAIAIDSTPPLQQKVDDQGITTITVNKSDLKLEIDSFIIESGSYFAVTSLPKISNSGNIKLISNPADIKVCQVTNKNPDQNNRELSKFSKPITVGFDIDSATESRAGGKAKLTIAHLQNDNWVDVEEIGNRVNRDDGTITTDTRNLGIFGLAAR